MRVGPRVLEECKVQILWGSR